MQRFVPEGPTKCAMKYEVYRNKSSCDEDFDLINQMYKRIMSEDKYLCEHAQKNLNTGVFVNGELHPRLEKGPLYFQGAVRQTLHKHHEREEKEHREIWPARQVAPAVEAEAKETSTITQEDELFCAKLVSQQQQRAEGVGCSTAASQVECCGGGSTGGGCQPTSGPLVF